MFAKQLDYDFNNSDILRAGQWSPTSWLCPAEDVIAGGQTCTSGKNAKVPDPWLVTPEKFEVDHCLSQRVFEQCSLQYSFTILIIVICCDIAKILAMCAALWLVSERPLATIGDAIASFLENPDTYTAGCCLIQQTQARAACHKSPFRWVPWRSRSQKQQYQHANRTFSEKIGPAAALWNQNIVRWYAVPSKSRWLAFGILYVGLLAASVAVLAMGIRDLSQLGIDNLFDQGFGSINPNVSLPSLMEVVISGLNITRGQAESASSASAWRYSSSTNIKAGCLHLSCRFLYCRRQFDVQRRPVKQAANALCRRHHCQYSSNFCSQRSTSYTTACSQPW